MLVFFGWINIYAAVYKDEHQYIFDFTQRYGKQMIWITVAFIFIILIFTIQSNVYSQLSYIIYAALLFSLVLVLIFAKEVNGARSWLQFGTIKIQPSEFAKLATALAFARFVSQERFKIKTLKDQLSTLALLALPVGLIILQDDTGSALIFAAFIFPFFREGMPGVYLFLFLLAIVLFIVSFFFSLVSIFLVLFASGLIFYAVYTKKYKESFFALLIFLGFGTIFQMINLFLNVNISNTTIVFVSILMLTLLFFILQFGKKSYVSNIISAILIGSIIYTLSINFIFNKLLEKHQRTRINVFLGIEEDVRGVGYNVNQSKIAIGSGGFYGKGFLQGTQTKLKFVPEQDTDFIFCTIGEEWGFIGTATVILVFLILILRIIFLAERQRAVFSRIYGYCVATILFLHFAINIGMTIGLAPVIGIPLPFFSYGGSSLWAFTIMLFIFLRLDVNRNETF
jgi:rod shape determining protein RodA